MKNIELVIQISEETYEHFLSRYKYQDANDTWLSEAGKVGVAIKNGKPLDSVLKENDEEIKAEIETIIGKKNLDDYDYCSGLICARNIIDKHRKAKSEKEYDDKEDNEHDR